MNKKKLALTLLLSSASVSVFAADAGTPAAAAAAAPAAAAAAAPAAAPAAVVATVGYFESAWSAVKGNQVMTAALVTTCILVGAVVHAAVASNSVEDEDAAE